MEIDLHLGSVSRDVHSCTHWLRPRNPPPPPALRGRYWSAKIDDISLLNGILLLCQVLLRTSTPRWRAWPARTMRRRGRRRTVRYPRTAASGYPEGNNTIPYHKKFVLCVADPDPGSGAFLTPGSRIRNRFFRDPRSRISDPKHILLRAY